MESIHEERASVLECGDERSGVAALPSIVVGLGVFRTLLGCTRLQSGDSADSVAAVQNLAAIREQFGGRASVLDCVRNCGALASRWSCIRFLQGRSEFEFIKIIGVGDFISRASRV